MFSEANITPNTPAQITAVIRKDWTQVASTFKSKKRNPRTNKTISQKPPQQEEQDLESNSEKRLKEEGSETMKNANTNNEE